MKAWPVQDAKARFSELLETCRREGPQLVTHRGEKAAVLVPVEEWERLNKTKPMDIKEWLLTDFARTDNLIPPMRKWRRRPPPKFDD
jgi:antitoxin Phd